MAKALLDGGISGVRDHPAHFGGADAIALSSPKAMPDAMVSRYRASTARSLMPPSLPVPASSSPRGMTRPRWPMH